MQRGKTVEDMFVGFPSMNEHRSERQCCIFAIYLFFFPNFHASCDFTTVPSHFPHFRQLPHALFYLLLPSNDCVQILVRPPAPKDSIYQDKHKINTLPTQTAHRRVSRSAADAGCSYYKAETPEKNLTWYARISACYLTTLRTIFFFFFY